MFFICHNNFLLLLLAKSSIVLENVYFGRAIVHLFFKRQSARSALRKEVHIATMNEIVYFSQFSKEQLHNVHVTTSAMHLERIAFGIDFWKNGLYLLRFVVSSSP